MSTLNPVQIGTGPGSFVFDPPPDEHHPLTVHYFRPPTLDEDTPVIFVMHGLLRDGECYRDRWREHAEEHGFLLIVPEFDRDLYPDSESYNLGGVVESESSRKFNCEEDWALHRIEMLFEAVQASTPITARGFGIYGHSAGAQFVHRLVLFHPESNFEVAVAANAGWYTLPCQETEFPYGLASAPISDELLARSLRRNLVVLLGEDDTDRADPNLRQTPEALEQGRHRFERGRSFINAGREAADRLNVSFGWRLATVPGAGHNDREMSEVAARYLLGLKPSI